MIAASPAPINMYQAIGIHTIEHESMSTVRIGVGTRMHERTTSFELVVHELSPFVVRIIVLIRMVDSGITEYLVELSRCCSHRSATAGRTIVHANGTTTVVHQLCHRITLIGCSRSGCICIQHVIPIVRTMDTHSDGIFLVCFQGIKPFSLY